MDLSEDSATADIGIVIIILCKIQTDIYYKYYIIVHRFTFPVSYMWFTYYAHQDSFRKPFLKLAQNFLPKTNTVFGLSYAQLFLIYMSLLILVS